MGGNWDHDGGGGVEVGWAVLDLWCTAGDNDLLGAQHRLLLNRSRCNSGGSAGSLHLDLSIANLVGQWDSGGSKGRASQGSECN